MLEVRKSATITGKSTIGGVEAATFYGTVGDSEGMSMRMGDMQTYMSNMPEVMKDQQDFMTKYQELKDTIEPKLSGVSNEKGDEA